MSDIDLYGWERCTHANIGLPGCPTCDPDKHRVAARYERKLDEAHAEVARWQAIATRAVEALEALGAMPEGYCWCYGNDRDPAKATPHTGECRDALAAIKLDSAGSTTATGKR